MFVDAIDRVDTFTRPLHSIIRLFGHSDIIPGTATLFFVNEDACAITCKHVAELISRSQQIYTHFTSFLAERKPIINQRQKNYEEQLKRLEERYDLKSGTMTQIKNSFVNCVDQYTTLDIAMHPTQDLAVVRFRGYNRLLYSSYATFLKDGNRARAGRSLCRLGYPFPEFTNFKYNAETDDIEWTATGRINTPRFPIDGIITRLMGDEATISGIEMSTPGLRGQSGGPLFDTKGVIYGMQSSTRHLHLGFDIENHDVMVNNRKTRVSNYPFLNVGQCIHVDIIKKFLREQAVKFYEE